MWIMLMLNIYSIQYYLIYKKKYIYINNYLYFTIL